MATKNKANILIDRDNLIITSGRQTTAANVRALIGTILDSYPNAVDGGWIFQAQLGYSSLITITDPKSFVHKDYVDTAVPPTTTISLDLTGGIDTLNLITKVGIVIVDVTTSDSSDTINNITNATNVTKIIFRPGSSLNLIVNNGAIIKLFAPALTIFGTKDGYLELTKRNSIFYQTAYIDQYT